MEGTSFLVKSKNEMSEWYIEFTYDKTLKQSKRLQNNVSVLYSSDKTKIQPEEYKKVDMKLSIRLPQQIEFAIKLE